ncbi:MAG: hypothetical protein IT422_00820 [Pirellulaceae bacterium]|jgi:hypothetical protein|nr:hypothetical protein [Pirellulaceae bacterium]
MRTNLKSFLARLALIALITLGVNVRLSAHDLPVDRSLTENATSNCFTSSPARVAPQSLLAIAPPDVGVAPRPQSNVLVAAMAKPQSTMAGEVDLSSALPQSLLAIAPPDVGVAPRPHSKLLPVAVAKAQPAKAGEVYMPYDFRMSDWRFGQFPYHGKTASALRPTALPSLADGSPCVPTLALSNTAEETQANPPTRTCVALGELIQQFEQLQCAASTALSGGPALSRSAFSIADSIERFVVASRRALFSGKPSETAASDQCLAGQPASPSSDLVGPQFVVYGSTIGEHVVLTLAQARAWQFEMPLANSRTADQSRLMKLLGAGLKPIQTSVLATATSGLQSAGHTLLKLSQSLSSISEPRVASGPQANPF